MSDDLGYEINLRLRSYGQDVAQKVEAAAAASMKRLVKATKAGAPRGSRLKTSSSEMGRPHLYSSISSMKKKGPLNSSVFVWYVRKPNYRIVHLVENEHKSKAGRIIAGRHFIKKALEQEIPKFEQEVQDIVRNP